MGWGAQADEGELLVYTIRKIRHPRAYVIFLTLPRRTGVSPVDIVSIFTSLMRSVPEYGCEVWHQGITLEQSDALEARAHGIPHL